jgi:phage terminase small subunit
VALTSKQEAFALAVVRGMNGSDAYRSAYNTKKMTAKTVNESASRLMANRKIVARITELRAPAVQAVRLEVEETLRHVARLVRSDPRKLFRADGAMIPVHELDEETALAIAIIEHVALTGTGENGKPRGYTCKVKFWDKPSAINMVMRHLGLFETDNLQKAPNIAIQVQILKVAGK